MWQMSDYLIGSHCEPRTDRGGRFQVGSVSTTPVKVAPDITNLVQVVATLVAGQQQSIAAITELA